MCMYVCVLIDDVDPAYAKAGPRARRTHDFKASYKLLRDQHRM